MTEGDVYFLALKGFQRERTGVLHGVVLILVVEGLGCELVCEVGGCGACLRHQQLIILLRVQILGAAHVRNRKLVVGDVDLWRYEPVVLRAVIVFSVVGVRGVGDGNLLAVERGVSAGGYLPAVAVAVGIDGGPS